MGQKEHYQQLNNKQRVLRINLTCDGIKNGLTYNEIQNKLNYFSDKHYANFRGECSASTVIRVIKELPFKKYKIEDIVEIEQNSYKDAVKKHDLEIISSDKNIGIIGIQVKSNFRKIEEFYYQFDDDINKAKEILIQKKLIILNGNNEDSIIQRNFIDQFQKIYSFCKSQSNN